MTSEMNLKSSCGKEAVCALILGVLVLAAAGVQANPALDASGFGHMANIRLGGYAQSEVLSNFPVLVKLGTNILGSNKNPLVTSAAWGPMLDRMNAEFAYFRDVMGWPPDKRAKRGYYSSIYLYGSGLCTDNAPNTATGGWQGSIYYQGENWPMVLASYVPVWSFDPAYPSGDTAYQQGGLVHEGVHSILADMPGCRNAGWFHEDGNNWLLSAAAAWARNSNGTSSR